MNIQLTTIACIRNLWLWPLILVVTLILSFLFLGDSVGCGFGAGVKSCQDLVHFIQNYFFPLVGGMLLLCVLSFLFLGLLPFVFGWYVKERNE